MSAPSGPLGAGQDLRLLGDAMLGRIAATPFVRITSETTTTIYAVGGNKRFFVYLMTVKNLSANAATFELKSGSTTIYGPDKLSAWGTVFYAFGILAPAMCPLLMGLADGDDFNITNTGTAPELLVLASVGVRASGQI